MTFCQNKDFVSHFVKRMTKYLTITISQWHKFHWTGEVSKKKKNWQKDDLVIQNDDSMYQKYWLKF